MDPDAVVEVFVLVIRCELYVDVFADARRDHPFFIVLDFEKWSAGRQDVQTLWGWWVVYQFYFQSMSFAKFETSKTHNAGVSAEKTVAANRIELVMLGQVVDFISLGFC